MTPSDTTELEKANRTVFARKDVVRWYATREALQGAEDVILRELAPSLRGRSMLDVGVGGGRTTVHFAPKVKSYLGVDYAREMVDACTARFATEPGWRFELADARALPYPDRHFDFVLFSHCGLDYVSHEDRRTIFDEMRRVLTPDGIFCFSTHNLQRARALLTGEDGEGAVRRLLRSFGRSRLRRMNPPLSELEVQEHAILNDGAFRSSARTYHIRPSAQVEELHARGFPNVRVMSAQTGITLSDAESVGTAEPWLYYLCTP